MLSIFFTLLILAFSSIAWGGILNQTIEGEGFYYFSEKYSLFLDDKIINVWHNFDNFARVLTYILEKLAGSNMLGYMLSVFFTILAINLTFYLVVKKLTGNAFIGFLSSLYFGINYASGFQFYARGHFQWYLQRVPEILLILPALLFLVNFFSTQKVKFYLLSLFLFFLSILMTHYTTLIMPLFVSSAIVQAIKNYKNSKKLVIYLFVGLSFVLVNYLIVGSTNLGSEVIRPDQTFLGSFEQIGQIVQKINFQLVVVTIPFALLKPFMTGVADLAGFVKSSVIYVYIFYLSVFLYLYFRKIKYFDIAIAFFIGLLGTLFLTAYIGRVLVYSDILQGRYFYLPSLCVGFILSVLVVTIIQHIAKVRKQNSSLTQFVLIMTIAFVWFGLNSQLIHRQIHDSQRYYTASASIMTVLDGNRNNFPEGSVIFLPHPPLPGAEPFLKKFYNERGLTFLFLDANWLQKIPNGTKIDNIYAFTYNIVPFPNNNHKIEVYDESEYHRQSYGDTLKSQGNKKI